jgi:hypothetical protein
MKVVVYLGAIVSILLAGVQRLHLAPALQDGFFQYLPLILCSIAAALAAIVWFRQAEVMRRGHPHAESNELADRVLAENLCALQAFRPTGGSFHRRAFGNERAEFAKALADRFCSSLVFGLTVLGGGAALLLVEGFERSSRRIFFGLTLQGEVGRLVVHGTCIYLYMSAISFFLFGAIWRYILLKEAK